MASIQVRRETFKASDQTPDQARETGVKFASDEFSVFIAEPVAPTRGGLIVIQEIFGVNRHIQSVARHYAEQGFTVWAPSYFDHIEKDVQLEYNDRSFVKGRELSSALGWDQALADTRTVAEALRERTGRKVACVGYCWGGSLAWLAACRLGGVFDACASYYGRATWEFRNETATAPIIFHFGERDPLIPMLNVQSFQKAQPHLPVHVYPAGHGFNCDERKDYDPESARLAEERTLQFFEMNGV